MVVLMLENAKASLRGELTRWLLEPRPGVFVGSVSALVRQKLWEKVCRASPEGGAMLLYRTQTEQGYRIETYGETQRRIVDMEGLQLVYVPKKGKHKWR